MLWLCLCFPQLPVEVFTRSSLDRGPLAISAGEGRRQAIVACNREARVLGLFPGMALGAAQARVSGLSVKPRDEAAEAAALARIAAWAGQFTPTVSLSPPQAVLLEVAGSLALFGGLSRLLGEVRQGLNALGYRP